MAQRGKNFLPAELKQLCFSFLEISQDPCVGNGQRKDNFWELVSEHYDANKPAGLETKTSKSLDTKWGDVRKAVTRFVGCYQAVEDLNISSTNSEDTLDKAKELFKQRCSKGKDFTFIVCWHILKDCPRLLLPEDNLRKMKSKKKPAAAIAGQRDAMNGPGEDAPTINLNSDAELEDAIPDTLQGNSNKRPVSSKLAKEAAKKQKSREESFKVAAQAQKVMAEIGRERLKVLESQTFMNMLTIPTDHLDQETLEFLRAWRKDEMAKLKERISARPSSVSSPLVSEEQTPEASSVPPAMHPTTSRSNFPDVLPSEEESSPSDPAELPFPH
ncbi:unnamed protein product [Calypogeia fissa]